jgi:hypothetical protein
LVDSSNKPGTASRHAAENTSKAASDAWNTAVEDAKCGCECRRHFRPRRRCEKTADRGVDRFERSSSSSTRSTKAAPGLRQNGGVAGQVASAQIGLVEGVATSVYGAGKGLVQLADGVTSLTNPLEWAANPDANIARLKSAGQTVESLGKIANLAQPTSWITDPKGNAQLAGALWIVRPRASTRTRPSSSATPPGPSACSSFREAKALPWRTPAGQRRS